jgi:hypothetical protein
MPIYAHAHAHAHDYDELFLIKRLADYPADLWAMGPSEVYLSIMFSMIA